MDQFKVIEVKRSVFENNDQDAEQLRKQLKKKDIFVESYVFSRLW